MPEKREQPTSRHIFGGMSEQEMSTLRVGESIYSLPLGLLMEKANNKPLSEIVRSSKPRYASTMTDRANERTCSLPVVKNDPQERVVRVRYSEAIKKAGTDDADRIPEEFVEYFPANALEQVVTLSYDELKGSFVQRGLALVEKSINKLLRG